MRRPALITAVVALAGCAPTFAPAPEAPPTAPPEPTQNVIVSDTGELSVRRSPLSQPFLRRADYDLQATTIARGVSLVVEPADDAPVYVSNLLAAALVRRFSGHEPVERAMSAPVVFLIRPTLAVETLTIDGHVIVDWSLRTERGRPVGAAYAARRVTGAVTGGDPWTAFTPEDAEFIAIQTAANLLEVEALRSAIEAGAAEAQAALTPTPPPRPITVVRQGSQPAPRFSPGPRTRPAQSD
ncbi:MAG: hypothetical protein AAFN79_03305 [Pseudomonadota bacterium]